MRTDWNALALTSVLSNKLIEAASAIPQSLALESAQ